MPNKSQGGKNENHVTPVNEDGNDTNVITPHAEEEQDLEAVSTTLPDVKQSDDDSPLSAKPTSPQPSILRQQQVTTASSGLSPNRGVSFGNGPNETSSSSHHKHEVLLTNSDHNKPQGGRATQEDHVVTSGDDQPKLYHRSSSIESQRALQSFRQSLSRIDDDRQRRRARIASGGPLTASSRDRWRPWSSWSWPRYRKTSIGVVSSMAVLAVRLTLDPKPTVYLIHSIIVFFDMVLIHFFTNSPWLSVLGESVTMLSFLAFHLTKETLFELLETTMIAVLCSFHLILSRNKHWDHEKTLTSNMEDLRKTSLHLLRHMDETVQQDIADQLFGDREGDNNFEDTSSIDTVGENTSSWFGYQHNLEAGKQHLKYCGEHFFENFLDGSAGVMYTSFLGLIISEVLTYGKEKNY